MHEQIYNEFLHDAEDLVEKLFRDIEALRAARFHDRQRRDLVANIFRHVHTMKGSAASHGAKSVSLIAHEFENVLDALRLGRLIPDERIMDAFSYATAAMSSALAARDQKEGEFDQARVIGRLRALVPEDSRDAGGLDVRASLPEEIARSLSAYDEQHLRETITEGLRLFVVSAAFEIETFDQRFRSLSEDLNQTGEIISTVPAPEPAATGEINFRLLYAAEALSDETIADISGLGRVQFAEIVTGAITRDSDQDGSTGPELQTYAAHTYGKSPGTVRVSLDELDEIILQASQLFRDTASAFDSLPNETASDSARAELRQRFVEIEERLVKLRLVPLGQLFERAAMRAGRIAAHNLGKDVEFKISGAELGIDRSLADAIADPLMHLVRNAVSHGIETPEARLVAGKTAQGRVNISAFAEGGHIHICVADDGGGIDPDRISKVAAAKGIIAPDSSVTLDECLRLIFRPGFSTAESLSNVSGRGIGLEIVDRAMARAAGDVRVASESGAGTTFEMIVPATIALIRCVILRLASQRYCVDSSRIADHGMLGPEQAVTENAIKWKGEKLPVVNLRALLGQANSAERDDGSSVIIARSSTPGAFSSNGQDRIAIIVDDIEAEQDLLVRSLGRHAASWPGVGGATELLDGGVALVLDLNQLLERDSS